LTGIVFCACIIIVTCVTRIGEIFASSGSTITAVIGTRIVVIAIFFCAHTLSVLARIVCCATVSVIANRSIIHCFVNTTGQRITQIFGTRIVVITVRLFTSLTNTVLAQITGRTYIVVITSSSIFHVGGNTFMSCHITLCDLALIKL
jgi:hypothetical protein